MKEAVGGFSLFNIVIVFILVFTGYVSLSINYSKAYNVKNEIINIIKNQGGVVADDIFKEQITDYFKEASYRATNTCKDGWMGFTRTGERVTDATRNKAAFCVLGIPANNNSELPNALYYKIEVFYQLDLPIISSVFRFTAKGETSRIYAPTECAQDSSMYTWCK